MPLAAPISAACTSRVLKQSGSAKVPLGQWQELKVVVEGNHFTYTINGHLMTDLTDNSTEALKDGVLALQLHQGFTMEIHFKDLRIKELK